MRCPDDPNLHWPRYGCVDYRRFAEHARQQHCHVAFATIPLLLAAYLGQALVLCAHHRDCRDCRDDLERLAEAARLINGLGDVRWADLPTLSRMNYQWRSKGGTLQLRPFGRRVAVELPRDVAGVAVAAHPRLGGAPWTLQDGTVAPVDGGAVTRRVLLERSVESTAEAEESTEPPAVRARFVLRRLLTETRDRLAVL